MDMRKTMIFDSWDREMRVYATRYKYSNQKERCYLKSLKQGIVIFAEPDKIQKYTERKA